VRHPAPEVIVTERISLEVPATLSALSTVRMVLGGLGARLDFSLEDLDDLFLATDRLLEAALDAEKLDSLRVLVMVDAGTLRISAGAFRSIELRDQVAITPGGCIDLCTLLQRLVDEVVVQEDDGSFNVVIVKRRSGTSA
jgi:anti-sigma regulatory factor (Ser/Thr protein kinase)